MSAELSFAQFPSLRTISFCTRVSQHDCGIFLLVTLLSPLTNLVRVTGDPFQRSSSRNQELPTSPERSEVLI
ncbi:hypothetical protein K491DRAFT_689634 [Lophiostoma macrostomum CBS 122681]|uniref:Uncharacterized protein n=1 Tax=Lophiostoma macrostomum CBS 122681 TaxID=1314788 RepID=A0A6A6THV0_9PLEO|nr:hypothetical protein K491DRAFT_689634 [Lophiostoma macrostomum CBS 122681]